MKGILYYDTKYGSTEQIGRWVASQIEATELCKLYDHARIDHTKDFYILGTPIFIGKPPQRVREFILANKKAMCLKPMFLFITSWAQSTPYQDECTKFIELLEFYLSPCIPVMSKSLPGRLYMDRITPKDNLIMSKLLRRIDNMTSEFQSKTIHFNDQTNKKLSEAFGSDIHEWLKNKSNML